MLKTSNEDKKTENGNPDPIIPIKYISKFICFMPK